MVRTCEQINKHLEEKIVTRGKEFFKSISGEAPMIFNKSWWTGKVMDWAMRNEEFKVQLFRFVDVIPYLNTNESLVRHIKEYFGGEAEVPTVLRLGVGAAGIGGSLAGMLMGKAIRSNIENMARQFIIGENSAEAVKGLDKLRKDKFAFTLDLLGEATVSEEESQAYATGYHEILDSMAAHAKNWTALPGKGPDNDLDWGSSPIINISIKPSALYSQAKAVDVEGSVEGMLQRLKPIYRKVVALGGALCIDMEQLKYQEITIELFKRLRSDPEFIHYPHLGLVLQAYLKDCRKNVEDLLDFARTSNLPFGLRLVKGAYWDTETAMAKQNIWNVPVWTNRAETDIAYESLARLILENHNLVYLFCASHNVRTISAVLETAQEMGVPENRYEFQVLYGMAEPVRKGLLKVAGRVRLYCPYGELIPGMGYLVRRLLENTANESFLRQSFVEGEDLEHLLENPIITLQKEQGGKDEEHGREAHSGKTLPFVNEAVIDFTVAANRQGFVDGIKNIRTVNGRRIPLFVGGHEMFTEDLIQTYNPADPNEILAMVCQAGIREVDQAVLAANTAFKAWKNTSPADRAMYMRRAADIARKRIFNLSALQVLEVGKQWDQAYADIGEGIDFMEYYAREMLRLGQPRRMGRAPGELNHLFYQPKGVAAVIAPWNFPFAIAAGMAVAAMVTGNPVIFKPSSIASSVGWSLVEIFREAGLPAGVFNYCPGRGSVIGDYLVEHPGIAIICFTGSMEVGLRIMERAAVARPEQAQVKRVIAEMGGKNAIIIDDDADLDEAVTQVLSSAFGFQGQKCSACSRVIVLDAIYERFTERLVGAAKSIAIGPPENPANYMGPLVDREQQKNVERYIELAAKEGRVLVRRDDLPQRGCYVPLVIVEGITPEHRLAQEEVFGPVLAVMRAKNFGEALDMANNTRFALTGGVFSRSPENLERAKREFNVGNLYLNRGSTGAMVERQPFGGYKMSGIGSKAGGPDYLLQFMDPRCVTENTMRRGFAPLAVGDDWI